MGIGFTEVRQHFKRAQIDLGVRDTVESPRYLWEALLRAGTTEKKRVTGGATASAREKRHGVARAWETAADRWGPRVSEKGAHASCGSGNAGLLGRPGKGESGPGWVAGFCVGAGPSGREMGRARGEEGEGLGQLAGWADFWVWAGFGFPISLVFLSFLFQTHSN